MAAIKTQKIVFGALLVAIMASSSAALAASDLLNSALNSSLEEKASVTAEYKSNSAADRPENHFEDRRHADRIELTMNGEINGGSGADRLKDHDSPNRIYREKRIQAKLDQELESVDREFSHQADTKPTKDKAEGFRFSEGRLSK